MKKTFYVFSSGTFRRQENTLYFESQDGQRRFIPVEDTAEIMVLGEVDVNKRFLEFLSQKEIMLHYFNHYGYYIGSFCPRKHLNSGYMLLKQVEHYLDEAKRLLIAKRFVSGAAANMLRVLKYYANRGHDVTDSVNALEGLAKDIETCPNTSALMGVEGNMREYYYRSFDRIIELEDFAFEARTRRPPRNRLNTLISFGNSLLYSLCLSEIYHTHLDPRIGYLHSTNFRRFTLNLDLAEVFKPVIVDRVIFTVLGRRMVTADDFVRDSGGILLEEKAKRRLVGQFEEKLRSTINHRGIGRPVSYRRLIRLELHKLEKHLIGEQEYEPFVATW